MDGREFGQAAAVFEVLKKAVGDATAAAQAGGHHDDPAGHDAHEHVDCRVPGVPPDPMALIPWMDHDLHATHAPAAAPKDPKEAMADLQAQTYATLLMMERGGVDSKQGHYAFLNTLDRVDDPVVRQKMMEKFQEQTGQSLQEFIGGADWEGKRDKEQALDLISPKRDAADAKLAAMKPEERKKLDAQASGWAQQIINSTTIDDANDDDNVQKITRVLGPRSPEEIEAIRAQMRKNTHGEHTVYEMLDRSLSGGNEDEAVAGLKGDPVYAAQVGLRNADGDPKRIKELLRGMDAKQLADFKQRNMMFGTAWVAGSVPEGADRAEIEKLVAGDKTGADGERIANLLKDPQEGMKFNGMMLSDQSKRDMEARKTDNVIKELEAKSPAELAAARDAWNKQAAANGGKTFEQMLDERYGADGGTDKLRIAALLRGDRASDKVLELREGMKEHRQSEIEDALANPDLKSTDDTKRKAAELEKAKIEQLAKEQDAREQQVVAIFTGKDPKAVAGRGVDQQLEAHYKEAVEHPDDPTSLNEMVARAADPDGERKKREVQAADDKVASKEDWQQGSLSTETQIYRAQKNDDTKTQAQLLENTKSNADLAKLKADYDAKYGQRHHTQLINTPDASRFAYQAQMAKLGGDERSMEDIEAALAHDDLNANELRIDNVRTYGVKAERDPALQFQLQKELAEKQHSGSLERHEKMRELFGGAVGIEEVMQEQLAVEDDMLTPAGAFGMTPRHLKDGVSKDDFQQVDKNLTSTLETQREEKVKYANHIASVLTTVAKLAALAVGQPELVALIDLASGLGAMALKNQIAGEAYDPALDAKLLVINTAVDLATIGISRVGKGATLGEEGVEQVTKEAGAVDGALAREASSAEGKVIQEAGATEGALAKNTESALAKDAEGGVAKNLESGLAKDAEAAEGSLAKDAGEVAQPVGKTVATMGVNAAGQVASGVVQGKSPTEILGEVVKGGLTAMLPAHFAGKVQEALGDATKAQAILGHIFGAATEFGTTATINAGDGSQGLINAAVQTIGGRANKLITKPGASSAVETAEAPREGETILGAPTTEAPRTESETALPSASETVAAEGAGAQSSAVAQNESTTIGAGHVSLQSGEADHRVAANAPATIERANNRRASMGVEARAQHDALFAATENPAQQVLLERATAAGASLPELQELSRAMSGMSDADALRHFSGAGLVQTFEGSCIPASYQIALAETNPVAAMKLKADPMAMMQAQKNALIIGGGAQSPRSDLAEPPAAIRELQKDPGVRDVMNDPTTYSSESSYGSGEGVDPTMLKDQALHSQLEAATGTSYEVITNERLPFARSDGKFDAMEIPHERIGSALDAQQPVMFGAAGHEQTILGRDFGNKGEVYYIVQNPRDASVRRLRASDMAMMDVQNLTLPAEAPSPRVSSGESNGGGTQIGAMREVPGEQRSPASADEQRPVLTGPNGGESVVTGVSATPDGALTYELLDPETGEKRTAPATEVDGERTRPTEPAGHDNEPDELELSEERKYSLPATGTDRLSEETVSLLGDSELVHQERRGRPTHQESESRVADVDLDGMGFREQVSLVKGQEVRYGTKGSTRPDEYSSSLRMSVDVKNYDVSTSDGQDQLVADTVQQALDRQANLPHGTQQGTFVDVRGQNVSPELLESLRRSIVAQSRGLISADNVQFITDED